MHMWRRKLFLCISYKMKCLQNETRKQKSVKEVTLQFSMIFQIRLKNTNNVNFLVICPLKFLVYIRPIQTYKQWTIKLERRFTLFVVDCWCSVCWCCRKKNCCLWNGWQWSLFKCWGILTIKGNQGCINLLTIPFCYYRQKSNLRPCMPFRCSALTNWTTEL
jgi:hypothetical protein